MKKISLFALMICSIPTLVRAETLNDVLAFTYENNPTIMAERTNLKATYGVTVYIVGDVNADGKVNSSDSDMILQWYMANVELTEERVLRGDANRDNAVNSLDALYILDVLQYQYK